MAKAKNPDTALLDGLRKAYESLPGLLPLTGTKGLFGAKGADLAETAIRDGYLTRRTEQPPAAKSKRSKAPIEVGVLTEKGIRRVVDSISPKVALEALVPAVRAIGSRPDRPSPDIFRVELEKATATCVGAIRDAFASLQVRVMSAVAPAGGFPVDAGAVLVALRSALEKVEPIPAQALPAVTPATEPRNAHDLEEVIAEFVAETVRRTTVGCSFDVLMGHLRGKHPALTIGVFHDALRKLHDAERIRLGGWPRMLDDLPEPELALFVSSKVMYYAQPAH